MFLVNNTMWQFIQEVAADEKDSILILIPLGARAARPPHPVAAWRPQRRMRRRAHRRKPPTAMKNISAPLSLYIFFEKYFFRNTFLVIPPSPLCSARVPPSAQCFAKLCYEKNCPFERCRERCRGVRSATTGAWRSFSARQGGSSPGADGCPLSGGPPPQRTGC